MRALVDLIVALFRFIDGVVIFTVVVLLATAIFGTIGFILFKLAFP